MFVLLCTCSCPRPPLLQRWWSSCHLRPHAWGSGSEQFLVRPTQSPTEQWSLTQLCTSAAQILRGRLLTLGATRTQQSLEDLQENDNSVGVFLLLMTDILYLFTVLMCNICRTLQRISLENKCSHTWNTDKVFHRNSRFLKIYIYIFYHRLFLSHKWHFGYSMFSLFSVIHE